ncbi:MFS transporter [Leptospira sp. GIMC2001]|uniref:MFS transporter n=1 Tax=Leptospira sp. GIMC2001 TaxID=1513297 RepID=UPI0004A5C509|nr:MFS transporter [Leptospira sp. GIMC2001]AID56200.1 tetracycline resistance protein [Leptospira sp. GIMC2001]WCL50543.1 MFS transporter [Leptospira sp. GIMC2001]
MFKKRNSILLFITVFADMMGFSVIFPIFPETIKYFLAISGDPVFNYFYQLALSLGGLEKPEFIVVLFGGILGSVYSVLQFIFSPFWGRLSDSLGRKNILIFTSAGNLIGYLVWLFSSSFSLFLLSRVITGSMGGNISVASASMADITTSQDRAKGMGMIGAGIGLGFIFGPLLGGLFSGTELHNLFPSLSGFGFTVFSSSALVSLLVAIINLILIIFLFHETLSSSDKKEKIESPFSHPILSSSKQSFRVLLFVSYIYFLFIFSFSGFEFCLNFFLNEAKSFTPREIGMTFLYIGLIIIFVQGGIVRRVSGKVSEIKIILSGVTIISLGYIGLIFLSDGNFGLFASLGFMSFGSALIHPGLSSLASLRSSSQEQGKNLGIFRSFGSLARAFSPISFALVYFGYGPYFVFILALGFSIFLGVSLLVWSRNE